VKRESEKCINRYIDREEEGKTLLLSLLKKFLLQR